MFGNSDKLVSFDEVSLFTNVPLTETIDIITNYVYKGNNVPPFSKLVFKRMLKLATGGLFSYNGKLYRQIDGVTMGNPLGPTLANFFLAHIENQIFSKTDPSHPKLYLRYVDDIFVVFPSETDFMKFLNILNSQHKNLQFTYELGNSTLAFLDTNISIVNADFESWVYRKETNTNVILNESAICPIQWKSGLVNCFLNRAWTICSNYKRFHEEVSNLGNIFKLNGYPELFFQKLVKRFLDKKYTKSTPVINEDKDKSYMLMIPYVGKPSLIFKQKISELVKKSYDVNLRCVFNSFKVKNYFSLKCRSSPFLATNLVYKFTCQCDTDITYIGETNRHIGIRAGEHLDLSKPGKVSPIGKHISSCEVCFTKLSQGALTFKDFEILKQCRSKFDAEINEALLVKKFRPKINTQLFKSGAGFTLKVFS